MARAQRLGLAAALACLAVFAGLAVAVTRGATMPFDLAVRGAVHGLASKPLTWTMIAVTQMGSVAFLVVAGLAAVWRLMTRGRRGAALRLVAVILVADVLDLGLKLVFHRPRPAPFFGIDTPGTYSFPSGHAILSCAFYGALAVLVAAGTAPLRKALVIAGAALLVAMIGFSRVYLGVHYPTDVLAGYALALAWLAAVRASTGNAGPFPS